MVNITLISVGAVGARVNAGDNFLVFMYKSIDDVQVPAYFIVHVPVMNIN